MTRSYTVNVVNGPDDGVEVFTGGDKCKRREVKYRKGQHIVKLLKCSEICFSSLRIYRMYKDLLR